MKRLLALLAFALFAMGPRWAYAEQNVVVDGSTYTIPDVDDENWGQNVTDWMIAITSRANAAVTIYQSTRTINSGLTLLGWLQANGGVVTGTDTAHALARLHVAYPAGSSAVLFVASTGTTKIFEVSGTSINVKAPVVWPDGSIQNSAPGASQWTTAGSDIYNTAGGKVGIGNTAPSSMLDVSGGSLTIRAGPSMGLVIGTSIFIVTPSGAIGVGTAAPAYKLDVIGVIRSTDSAYLATDAGSVGIGTTNPSSKLDVATGTSTFRNGLIVGGGTLTVNGGNVTTTGNVGIGTQSPSSGLDIFNSSVTIRGANKGLVVGTTDFSVSGGKTGIGTASPRAVAEISGQTGAAGGPTLIVSTGTTKLFEVTGTSATFSVPVFFQAPPNEIWLFGNNGHGSGSTAIKRFSTIVRSSGTALSYAGDNSVLGATITVNQNGLYAITYCQDDNSGVANFGVSVNSTQLTTAVQNIALGTMVLITETAGTNIGNCVSGTIPLFAGDIVRPHDDPLAAGTQTAINYFKILKVQ